MKYQPIDKIRKRFKKEWLLIATDRLDPKTQTPLRGRLLAHSPRREDIDDAFVRTKALSFILYSEKTLPHDYAIAFCA